MQRLLNEKVLLGDSRSSFPAPRDSPLGWAFAHLGNGGLRGLCHDPV